MPGGPPEPPETAVDGSLILARFPSELLLHLAEECGNPLALLISKAHLSKAFSAAARAALAILTHIDLRECVWTADDAAVAGVVSNCSQLSSLNLYGWNITDAAVAAVALGCRQLTMLKLCCCDEITDAAVAPRLQPDE